MASIELPALLLRAVIVRSDLRYARACADRVEPFSLSYLLRLRPAHLSGEGDPMAQSGLIGAVLYAKDLQQLVEFYAAVALSLIHI